jgi:hypothetical protein
MRQQDGQCLALRTTGLVKLLTTSNGVVTPGHGTTPELTGEAYWPVIDH